MQRVECLRTYRWGNRRVSHDNGDRFQLGHCKPVTPRLQRTLSSKRRLWDRYFPLESQRGIRHWPLELWKTNTFVLNYLAPGNLLQQTNNQALGASHSTPGEHWPYQLTAKRPKPCRSKLQLPGTWDTYTQTVFTWGAHYHPGNTAELPGVSALASMPNFTHGPQVLGFVTKEQRTQRHKHICTHTWICHK